MLFRNKISTGSFPFSIAATWHVGDRWTSYMFWDSILENSVFFYNENYKEKLFHKTRYLSAELLKNQEFAYWYIKNWM